jgi:hypothetical protein
MLYGKPTKHIRHFDESTLTIGPQRFQTFPFWKYDDSATARTDGLDLKDEKKVPEGSRITKHKVEILVTPETIEPQQIYIGRIKLSFNDVFAHPICGGRFEQASYGDTATENFVAKTNPIGPQLFPDQGATDAKTMVKGQTSTDLEIGGSSSGFGIKEWLLDDHIKHYINLKKVTVFDQRPLMGERWQRVPSKVKRVNEGTWYGLFIFNDSERGATPADTQVKVNIKSYWEEMAI